MNSEQGFVLPVVLAAMAAGTLLLSPFLSQASTSLMSSRDYTQSTYEQHSADAGVEHAIWDLAYGDLTTHFPDPGSSFRYSLDEAVNGIAPDITVTMTGSPTYVITSTAGDRTIRTTVDVVGTDATIRDWQVR
ncbi:MAG: hypothetical protein HOC20_03740 [Chloroflexi bacterium]|jgi:hypothetical protein|nr:hypothetical protein [Chloroflexota bacterium]